MGILGTINAYYREMLIDIYLEFGSEGFTCNDIRDIDGFEEFQCQLLRSWHNYKLVKNTLKKLKGERKPVRVWRFTSQALYALKLYLPRYIP